MDKQEREKRWAATAVRQELDAIQRLPSDYNIHTPNNQFWQSLFRIAGIAKAGHFTEDTALNQVLTASGHLQQRESDIAYQWRRAYARAEARYPKF